MNEVLGNQDDLFTLVLYDFHSKIRALIDRRCILSTYYHILHTFPIEEMCMGTTTHPQIISGCHFSVDIFQKGLCINHLQLPISKCHFSFAVDWAKDKIAFIQAFSRAKIHFPTHYMAKMATISLEKKLSMQAALPL